MADERQVSLTVNGTPYSAVVETRVHLADFLRLEAGLTGTHLGCEHGVCGACTVVVDEEAVRSCLMLAVQADQSSVVTIEGLDTNNKLHPVQEAFRDHHGLQCGFCTPGIVLSITAYLKENPNPTDSEVREAISGNICRCTGYQGIVAAALQAARVIQEEDKRQP